MKKYKHFFFFFAAVKRQLKKTPTYITIKCKICLWQLSPPCDAPPFSLEANMLKRDKEDFSLNTALIGQLSAHISVWANKPAGQILEAIWFSWGWFFIMLADSFKKKQQTTGEIKETLEIRCGSAQNFLCALTPHIPPNVMNGSGFLALAAEWARLS